MRIGTPISVDSNPPIEPKDSIDITGPAGETIFYRMIAWNPLMNDVDKFNSFLEKEFAPIKEFKDDRVLVLVGALIIENAVNEVLSSVMPGFNKLNDRVDFTASMRNDTLRAMRIVPSRLVKCADCIRKIRNDFAHQVEINEFSKLKPQHLSDMKDLLKTFKSDWAEDSTDAQIFESLVGITALSLHMYSGQTRTLNDFIRSSSVELPLVGYIESKKG